MAEGERLSPSLIEIDGISCRRESQNEVGRRLSGRKVGGTKVATFSCNMLEGGNNVFCLVLVLNCEGIVETYRL